MVVRGSGAKLPEPVGAPAMYCARATQRAGEVRSRRQLHGIVQATDIVGNLATRVSTVAQLPCLIVTPAKDLSRNF
jgi:hypothetical protein